MIGDRLKRTGFAQTFAEEFATTADAKAFATAYPHLRTNFYFGYQRRDKGLDFQFTSRAYPGTRNVMVDGVYMPGALTPRVMNGMLYINGYPLTPAQAAAHGQGKRDFAAAMISTQDSFSQAFGYFEVRAKLPEQSGTWPAFWLLPTVKTPANGGRLAEIDVFEHYGGIKVDSAGNRYDRVGRPFSTLHYLNDAGVEAHVGNANDLTKAAYPNGFVKQATIPPRDLKQFHTYGVLWSPEEFIFYIDDRETFRTPNPGVSDPHYMVVNLDISENGGAVDPKLNTSLIVDWVRAWKIGS